MKKYVDVIVPFPLAGYYTYAVPEDLNGQIQIGCRVVVQFGAKRFYTAIVAVIHEKEPVGFEVKAVSALLDASPVLLPLQFRLWKWIADYYLCSEGDVYKAAMPSGLKLESETMVVLNPDFESDISLPFREQILLDLLAVHPEQCITRLEKESGIKNLLPVIKSLLDKDAVRVKEEVKYSYKPKMEQRVRFCGSPSQQQLHVLFDTLSKSKKQLEIVMCLVEMSGMLGTKRREVSKKDLLDRSKASLSALQELVRKKIVEIYTVDVGRLQDSGSPVLEANPLNVFQQKAFDQILERFQHKNVCLLHGVTASGKTEIYIHLIQKFVREGKQVLYLLPEIALTTQITTRLKRVFGSRLGVYHSKFPDAERVEIWNKQLSEDGYDIVLGVRSAVFLPFRNLGLVIVDEEHESTYKQQDPSPRYHARDTAIVLASMTGAKVLLGTATPSVESWYNATVQKKYGLVSLKERYQEVRLPEITPVDIRDLRRKKRMCGQFSPLLIQTMRDTLTNREQVILFQNRRGFAPMVECRTCGWVPKCKNCDVSLTYHKGLNRMSCHYCGYTCPVPKSCPACEGTELSSRGFGTEKIEEEIGQLFPDIKTVRMDLDTTRSRSAYERIITDFTEGKAHILVGTQMISKGLDFEKVRVVGILNADTMLNYPDFRSYERAFQLMAQVAGRAGRKGRPGKVILQTRSMDHPIIRQVIENDYEGMVEEQLAERQLFRYPPFYRLIYVYIKHRKEDVAEQVASDLGRRMRELLGDRVLGPDKPPVGRVQTFFIRKIMLKIEAGGSVRNVRDFLQQVRREIFAVEKYKSVIIYYDVDPM